VGQPSPVPPIMSDYLARRAQEAAKAAKKAEWKAKRLAADPNSTASHFDKQEAPDRKQQEAAGRKQQEALNRKQQEAADRQEEEAAEAEHERLLIAQNIDASIEELVAKKQALWV